MKLLLDTHAFFWWDSDPGRLSPAASAAVRDRSNVVLVSTVTIWEMVIKAELGKLTLRLPLADIVAQQQANGMVVLPVTLPHTLAVQGLPPIHRDPFDRLLIAQANAEGAELVSADHLIARYPVQVLW
jgi:PIN domain nuclease of toxin-antitoxin system